MNVLITGGAGYIGSHTIVELTSAGHNCISVDNFSNSSPEAIKRVSEICGQEIVNYDFDVVDEKKLSTVFEKHNIDAVVHFAAFKAVGESVQKPLDYYKNNLVSLISLLGVMKSHSVNKLIFSSSATVYGDPDEVPITEESDATRATNPYGSTKVMAEQIIVDFANANPNFEATLLRYFNPVGAHSSGKIGEDPKDIPNNLMPYISQVASGKLEQLTVFGSDYDTPDGTGVRDYIHVVDLARGHVAAIDKLTAGVSIYNLGTGHGVSVLEAVKTFEQASGKKISYNIAPRREGDIATCYADPALAQSQLGWKADRTFEDACSDVWRWQSQNPQGYNQG